MKDTKKIPQKELREVITKTTQDLPEKMIQAMIKEQRLPCTVEEFRKTLISSLMII